MPWILLHQIWQIYIYVCVISVPSDQIYPPISDEVNNSLNFSDKVYPQIRYTPHFQMKWTTHSTFQMRCTLRSDIPPIFRWSEQLTQLFRWGVPSDQIYPPVSDEVNNLVNFSDEVHTETQSRNEFIFSDEVFMCRCCIGNMTSWTLSNLCRLLCVVDVVVVVAVTVACCCCPAIVLVHVQLQMNFNTNKNIT